MSSRLPKVLAMGSLWPTLVAQEQDWSCAINGFIESQSLAYSESHLADYDGVRQYILSIKETALRRFFTSESVSLMQITDLHRRAVRQLYPSLPMGTRYGQSDHKRRLLDRLGEPGSTFRSGRMGAGRSVDGLT